MRHEGRTPRQKASRGSKKTAAEQGRPPQNWLRVERLEWWGTGRRGAGRPPYISHLSAGTPGNVTAGRDGTGDGRTGSPAACAFLGPDTQGGGAAADPLPLSCRPRRARPKVGVGQVLGARAPPGGRAGAGRGAPFSACPSSLPSVSPRCACRGRSGPPVAQVAVGGLASIFASVKGSRNPEGCTREQGPSGLGPGTVAGGSLLADVVQERAGSQAFLPDDRCWQYHQS